MAEAREERGVRQEFRLRKPNCRNRFDGHDMSDFVAHSTER